MSNPNSTLCLGLHRTWAILRFALDEELGIHHGIDFDEFALLQALADADGGQTSLAVLAAGFGAPRSAMLRRLRPLEKIGLLACHGRVADRRVALRPAARPVLGAAHETVDRVCARQHPGPALSALTLTE
jgi:DNA-binding IclR family transcriptional regulator